MSNRSRIRCLGLVAVLVSLCLMPMALKFMTWWGAFKVVLMGVTGVVLLKESAGESAKSSWPYLLGLGASGLMAYEYVTGAWGSFHGLGLRSITNTTSGLFGAWCAVVIACIFMGMLGKKTKFEDSMSVPAKTTAWMLGIMATLSGVNQILNMRLDGFFGTISALVLAVSILGMGIMLLKDKQPHLACYGLGVLTAGPVLWKLASTKTLKALLTFSMTSLSFYGMFAAVGVIALVGSWALGTEVMMANQKAAAK